MREKIVITLLAIAFTLSAVWTFQTFPRPKPFEPRIEGEPPPGTAEHFFSDEDAIREAQRFNVYAREHHIRELTFADIENMTGRDVARLKIAVIYNVEESRLHGQKHQTIQYINKVPIVNTYED